MRGFSCKNSVSCAVSGFLKWIVNSRMVILLCICVFVYACVVEPIKSNAVLMGEPMNVLEPYIAALNSGMILLIAPLGFLTLISDYPKIDCGSIFYIFRIGRRSWLCGQILQLAAMALAYVAAIFATAVAGGMASNGFFGGEWSAVATRFTSEFPDQRGNFGVSLLPENLYNQMPLGEAAINSTLFVLAYLFTIGMVLLAFSIARKKSAGIVACGLLIAIGAAFCSINTKLMWLLPMAHSVVWLHYTEFLREPVFPISYSVVYFIAIIAALLAVCAVSLKRFDYSTISLEVQS